MKKLLLIIALLCVTTPALAQNLTTVSAANIQDINGIKLANSSAGGAGQEMEPTIQAVRWLGDRAL